MARPRMHADEVEVDDDLVAGLLVDQFPTLADRPRRPVDAWGTDHALVRLGDDLVARLPIIAWAAEQAAAAVRWLPVLGPHLPVEVPAPVAVGRPGRGYPFTWSVAPWLEGAHPTPDGPDAGPTLAADLAEVVRALRAVPVHGAPKRPPGRRGGALASADPAVQAAADRLRAAPDEVDVDLLLAVWDDGVRAPSWTGPPVWVHGDLSAGNLLLRDGRLAGVLDWGSPAVGDPAVDLMVAWSLFDPDGRAAYRDALGADDAAWRRGRAWAVAAALEALPYYRDTNPDIVARSHRVAAQVTAEARAGSAR